MHLDYRQFIFKSLKKIQKYIDNFEETFEAEKTKAMLFFTSLVKQTIETIENPLDVVIKRPGNFYLFSYESYLYNQGKLPWYDMYPLIIVLSVYNTGFLGINWHWIEPRKRALILKKVIQGHPEDFFEDRRLSGMNYKRLLTDLGYWNKKFIKVAIRRYRWDGLRIIKGLKVCRIKNIDMIDAISMVSPMYKGISDVEAERWIKENTQRWTGPIKY